MTLDKEEITLKIDGMTCSHCALTVEKALKNNGAENVMVDFVQGEAKIKSKGTIDSEALIAAVKKAGYQAKKKSPDLTHDHDHSHPEIEKKFFLSLVFTLPLFSHMFFPHNSWINNPFIQIGLCLPVMVTGWVHFGKSALGSIRTGSPNMDVLITIGSTSAFVYSLAGTYMFFGMPEMHNYLFFETSASIITLVLLGNLMEHRSIKKTTSAIKDLHSLQPATAKKIIYENNKEIIQEINIKEIRKGDIFLVNTGDKIPVDCEIISGTSFIDESMISGESLPVSKSIKEKVIGGTIITDGTLKIKATEIGDEMVLSKIIEMVKSAQHDKPKIQRIGDRVSAVFVPVVIIISFLTFFISYLIFNISGQTALMNSIAVLVIACPCAMGLATPTAVMVGLGRAAKNGILIKGAGTVEEFANIKTIVFDKTGTLTTGNFKIRNISPVKNFDLQELTDIIFHLEKHSSHPIAKSLTKELSNKKNEKNISELKDMRGIGIIAKDETGNTIEIGSDRLLGPEILNNDLFMKGNNFSTKIFVLKNKSLVGMVEMEDELKENAFQTISSLNTLGINTILLSGDNKEICERVAQNTGIKTVYSQKMPEEKMEIISKLAKENPTAMVGDGINDAPSLVKANVGISLSNSTQIAINSAQIILLESSNLHSLLRALQISKLTLSTIKQNLFWAFFYNVLAIPLAALGFLNPMVAALTMAFSDVIVIGNSLRLRVKKIGI